MSFCAKFSRTHVMTAIWRAHCPPHCAGASHCCSFATNAATSCQHATVSELGASRSRQTCKVHVQQFSAVAVDYDSEENDCSENYHQHERHVHTDVDSAASRKKRTTYSHCETCSCESNGHSLKSTLPETPLIPSPRFSVRRRVLPTTLPPLNSTEGRKYLLEALQEETSAPYIPLTEHFCNQSDVTFCGVTTLQMCLNALAIDPQVRWKHGWRYFGSEEVLLSQCCLTADRVRQVGVTLEEFSQLAVCQGLRVTTKRPTDSTLDTWRDDVLSMMRGDSHNVGLLVASFDRGAIGQTGDGHFSPIAAYHKESDRVLMLDVARFKYQPYWVSVESLYDAMKPLDEATGRSRGWFILQPPSTSSSYKGAQIETEERRPISVVPQVGHASPCPLNAIKVDYCRAKIRALPSAL